MPRENLSLSFSQQNLVAVEVMRLLAEQGGDNQRSPRMWKLMLLGLKVEALLGDVAVAADGNADARFVVEALDERGLSGLDRADEIWAMLAAYLRGEAAQQHERSVGEDFDAASIMDALDGW